MATPQLDHIVVHVPLDLLQSPPQWLTDAFTISPGGTHGDGKTTNKLIIFADGTYLELLAFTSPEARKGHFWGDKGYGIIDYAFTYPDASTYVDTIQPRLEAARQQVSAQDQDLFPGPLGQGSRLTPTGERLEWKVAFPAPKSRGATPFWCFDQTPRERRVPISPAATTHPSGAIGVSRLTVYVKDELEGVPHPLKSVLNASIPTAQELPGPALWQLDEVHRLKDATSPPQIIAHQVNTGSDEEKAFKERGRIAVMWLSLLTASNVPEPKVIHEAIGDEGDTISISF